MRLSEMVDSIIRKCDYQKTHQDSIGPMLFYIPLHTSRLSLPYSEAPSYIRKRQDIPHTKESPTQVLWSSSGPNKEMKIPVGGLATHCMAQDQIINRHDIKISWTSKWPHLVIKSGPRKGLISKNYKNNHLNIKVTTFDDQSRTVHKLCE